MKTSELHSSILFTFSKLGRPNQLRSFFNTVFVMLVINLSPSFSFLKSKKKISPLRLFSLKKDITSPLHSSKEVSSTSTNTTADLKSLSALMPVGSVLEFLRSDLRLKKSFKNSIIFTYCLQQSTRESLPLLLSI